MANIIPTVGRVVWYWPHPLDGIGGTIDNLQPMAAIVTYVHAPTLVNATIHDHCGEKHARAGLHLLPADEADHVEGRMGKLTWMPYQLGQAARTEAAEAHTRGDMILNR